MRCKIMEVRLCVCVCMCACARARVRIDLCIRFVYVYWNMTRVISNKLNYTSLIIYVRLM